MSSLADTLAAEVAAFRKGPPCGLEVILDKLDDKDRQALEAYMDDRAVPATVIVRALKAAGHDVGANVVTRHRGEKCRCGR